MPFPLAMGQNFITETALKNPWYMLVCQFCPLDIRYYTWILYIYCPVWRETWRFVPPRKFMSPEGEARGRHEFSGWEKTSCLPTNWAINYFLYWKLFNCLLYRSTPLYSAKRCAVRHDRETRQFIKWSGISPSFARLWLAETAFTRVYLRVNWPLTAFSGLFGVSIFS